MMWSSKQLSEALSVAIPNNIETCEIQFNSRDVKPGDLFIAIKGARGDGHSYVDDAVSKGAAAVVVSDDISSNFEKVIKVSNTIEALTLLAQYKRKHSKAKFIAITGSVGKTSTKEIIKLILQPFGKVFASRGNFNNYLGVPINLASMTGDEDFAVIELGMNHPGEIKQLTTLVKPDIAIITEICEAHIEFFNSLEEIADAKCEIFEGFKKDGIAIVNRDIKCFGKIADNLKKYQVHKIYTFSSHQSSQCKLESYDFHDTTVDLTYNIRSININMTLPAVPWHQAQNFASALLLVDILWLDINQAIPQLKLFEPMLGRGKIINATKGDKKYQLICDYYNASYYSVKASLEYLKQIKHPKKVVIIGDMSELGEHAITLHQTIAPYIIGTHVTKALFVGENVKYIHELMPNQIVTTIFKDVDHLLQNLEKFLDRNELILIKGANKLNLQKILEFFD